MEKLYSILKPQGIASRLLLPATDLETARKFMRDSGLTKVSEKHFDDHGLVHWFVDSHDIRATSKGEKQS